MKKIKLVVSDLHLGTGKLLDGGNVNSLEEFHYDDRFSEFVNYYTSGDYQDAEVELILNGDILNLIQTDYRGHYLSVITESISLEKLVRVVEGHPGFFNALRKFVKLPNHSITYVVGNHDQEMLWPATRQYLNEAIGTTIRYRNIVYYFDGVHIEHGHMHEPANRIDPKKFFIKKNIPEPILHLPFGSYFFVEFVMKIKQDFEIVDKVRPFKAFIRWSLFQYTWFSIKTISKCLLFFIQALLLKDGRRKLSLKSLVPIVFGGNVFPDLGKSAIQILKDERVNVVIFGHSHVYQFKQWDTKQYFNTGTWTEITSLDMSSFGKITKLTYVLIEYSEGVEKPSARLKEWKGFHRIEEDVDVT